MPYTVTEFTAAIAAKGLASPNKFEVEFTKIPSAALAGGGNLKDLNLMCESASLAGRNIQSLLDRQYGLNREVAYNGPTYQPMTLSFLCSSQFKEKKIFDRWNNMIVDISSGFDVAYYTHYIGEMTVHALDVHGKRTFSTMYKECWPKTVSAIELNHSTQNAAVRMSVEITYAYWETEVKGKPEIKSTKVGTSVTPTNPSSG